MANHNALSPLRAGIAVCAMLALAAHAQQRMTVTAVPASGQSGQSVQTAVAGAAPAETVTFSFNGVTAGPCTASVTGACSAQIPIPTGLAGGSYPLVAQGSTGDSASTSITITMLVFASPSSGTPGQSMQATLAGALPSETVEIYVNGADDHASCSTGSVGTCSANFFLPVNLPAGSYPLTAKGSNGDSATVSITIVQSMTVTAVPASGQPGQSVQASVAAAAPAEAVTFSFNGVNTGSCFTSSSGACTAQIQIPVNLPGGSYALVAQGSTGDSASTSITITMAVAVAPSAGIPGQTVYPVVAGAIANETVQFYVNGEPVSASCATGSSGSCTTNLQLPANLPAGSYSLTAKGSNGDSATVSITIVQSMTVTAVPASGQPGQSVQASVAAAAPAEAVTFSFNGVNTGSCFTSSSGACSETIVIPTGLAGGSYALVAQGSTGDSASTSITITMLVFASPSSGTPGQTVYPVVAGAIANETVQFYLNGEPVSASCATGSSGSCTTNLQLPANLPPGSYPLTAKGSGGDSATVTVTITQTCTVTDNSDSPNDSGSLRYCVNTATAGDTISFASSLNWQTITLSPANGPLTIGTNLTIQGP